MFTEHQCTWMATRILSHLPAEIANLKSRSCWERDVTQKCNFSICNNHESFCIATWGVSRSPAVYWSPAGPDLSQVTQPSSIPHWINVCPSICFCFCLAETRVHTHYSTAIDPLWSQKVSHVFLFTLPPFPSPYFLVPCLGCTSHQLLSSSDSVWRLTC